MSNDKFNRRRFIKTGTAALIASSLPLPLKSLAAGGRKLRNVASDSLNVIFMTADDLGWKDLSCYGNKNIKTPHLDSLAHQGIRFDRCFGVSSSCSSSRASFITGQYINTHGVDGLVHRHLSKQLSPVRPTMPQYFREAGYHTAIEGKWHVSLLPTNLYGYSESMGSALIWKKHIKNVKEIERYFYSRAKQNQPFYLELNFTDTHRNAKGKFESDPRFTVRPDSIEVPEWMGLPNWPEIRADLAQYYQGLLKTDHLVGLTLSALKKHGLEQNTIVVFVSDNGSPFPGNKMTLYDRGIGSPLLMRLPGTIAANRTSQAMVSTIDLMPTILDLCKIGSGKEIEGKSFSPLLLDEKITSHRQHIFAEMNYHVKHIPMRAIRTDRFKAIENLSDSPIGLDDLENEKWALKLCELKNQPWLRKRVPFELYDLASDPNETRNLAGSPELAEVESQLRLQLKKF